MKVVSLWMWSLRYEEWTWVAGSEDLNPSSKPKLQATYCVIFDDGSEQQL